MDLEVKRRIIQMALDRFGLDHQIDKMIEELGELLQATIKLRQANQSGKIVADKARSSIFFENFIEELADVDVLRDQILHAFNMEENDGSLFAQIKERKFLRLHKRMTQSNLDEYSIFSPSSESDE